jgi:hypothetical protein
MAEDVAVDEANAVFAHMTVGGPTPRREVLARSRQLVANLWASGHLPKAISEDKWIVGYEVHYRHMGPMSLIPITVGPKRPRRFRFHYARARSWDAWGAEQT